MKKSLLSMFFFALICSPIYSQYDKKSNLLTGNWNNPLMWYPIGVPDANDKVLVKGSSVNINDGNAKALELVVESGAVFDTKLNIQNDGILTVTQKVIIENVSDVDLEINLSGDGKLIVPNLHFKRLVHNNGSKFELTAIDSSFINVSNNFHWELDLSTFESYKEIELRNKAILQVAKNTTFDITGGYAFDITIEESAKFSTLGQLTINKLGGEDFNLNLNNGKPIFEAKTFIIDQTGGNGNSKIEALNGTFRITGISSISNSLPNNYIEFLANGASSKLDFRENINLFATSEADILFTIENKSKFLFGGNFTRGSGFGHLAMDPNTTFVFDGSSSQTVPSQQGNGTDSFTFGQIEFANTSGQAVTLLEDLVVEGNLMLMNGVVTSEVGKMLIFGENATVSGGSTTNYISGPVKKIGLNTNAEFTFPIGHLGKYAPMTIYSTVKASGEFTSRFINCPPPYGNVDPTQTPQPLDHVSELERWTLERSVGSDDVDVRLHWSDATTAGISDTTSLVVAMYDGTNWVNIGRSEPMGSAAAGQAGSIKNGINCPPPYGMTELTFGATTQEQNLLPVVLTDFYAVKSNNEVKLNWITAQEINTDRFAAESSNDGVNFSRIAEVKAQGNSTTKHSYSATDANPKVGYNYYRLRQIDLNGMYTLSDVIGIEFREDIEIQINPNPVSDLVTITGNFPDNKNNSVKVFDQIGRSVFEGYFPSKNGSIEISTEKLRLHNAGLYYVQVNIDNATETLKMYKSE